VAGNRLRQPAYEIFSIKRLEGGGRQRGVPLKSGYFTATGSSSVKTVADRHTYNKH